MKNMFISFYNQSQPNDINRVYDVPFYTNVSLPIQNSETMTRESLIKTKYADVLMRAVELNKHSYGKLDNYSAHDLLELISPDHILDNQAAMSLYNPLGLSLVDMEDMFQPEQESGQINKIDIFYRHEEIMIRIGKNIEH